MKKTTQFVIHERLLGHNEFKELNNLSYYKANQAKQNQETTILYEILSQKVQKVENYPIKLKITFYEPNRKRDFDNIIFSIKFIQDAMIKAKVIVNDGQKQINKLEFELELDKEKPRILVEIFEED